MDYTILDGKSLGELKGFTIKPVRTANSENKYKYIVINSVPGNRDTATVVWLSKSLSSKYEDMIQPHPSCVVRAQFAETGEFTHFLLVSPTLYISIEQLLEMYEGQDF